MLKLQQRVVELSPCPVCKGRSYRKLFVKDDRHFWRCTSCNLEKLHPLPTLEELREYYEAAYASGMYKPFIEASDLKYHTAKYHFERIRPFCRPGRWLDIGAANGLFVQCAREAGMDAEGIEITQSGVDAARARDVPIFRGTIEEHTPNYLYDTITAFDILEHVVDPLSFLGSIKRLLKPGGTFVLALPNQASVLRRLMGSHWFYYIPEEHMFYYNPDNIRRLVARAGLTVSRWSREAKPLTYNYTLIWAKERRPLAHRLMSLASPLFAGRLGEWAVPLFLGDMMVFGQREREED